MKNKTLEKVAKDRHTLKTKKDLEECLEAYFQLEAEMTALRQAEKAQKRLKSALMAYMQGMGVSTLTTKKHSAIVKSVPSRVFKKEEMIDKYGVQAYEDCKVGIVKLTLVVGEK